MKLQLIRLASSIVGALAIATLAAAYSSPSILTEKIDEYPISMTKGIGNMNSSAIEELNLTAEQQEQADAIQADVDKQIAEILTAEQLETLETAQTNGDDMRSVMMSLGLTSEQRSNLMGVMRTSRDEMMEVLTPEQRAQLEGESPRDRN